MDRFRPDINRNNIVEKLDAKFIRVFDYQYAPNRHYYNATRRQFDDLMVLKSDEEFKQSLPDAVTVMVVICNEGEEPKLLMAREYRYPAGQYLMSPPAGVLDEEDKKEVNPILFAAKRELMEEAGISIGEKDRLFVINPLLFSTPGLTDESNAIVCAVINQMDLSILTQKGAEGSELFDGFMLLTKRQAETIISNGRDEEGLFYSVYTLITMCYFVSDVWKNKE